MYQHRSSVSFLILVCLLGPLLTSCAKKDLPVVQASQQASCITRGWPQDNSDLRPDPSLLFGRLENGLRYVIMANHEPKNRVGLFLDVQTGSLQETDRQQGLAHYLEHMLFNGTTHHPPGSLVEYFQSIGMGFGADTNAHTSYDETVYKLFLPHADHTTMAKGLEVMADYARGALLLEKEVDKERGIILSEKRARDSARSRVYKKKMQFAFAGTRVARRDVIGTDKTINAANAALLRDYYDTWYRPDNMILVIVGDVDPATVEIMVKQRFAALRSAGRPIHCPAMGRVIEDGVAAFYLYEPDLGYTDVTLESLWNVPPVVDSKQVEQRRIQEDLVGIMFDNRLQHLVQQPKSPLTKAHFYTGRFLEQYKYSSIASQSSAKNWRPALRLLDQTLRQALTWGFTLDELQRAKKELVTALTKQARGADGRKSSELANELIRDLNNNTVFMSPAQELALYGALIDQITLTDVQAVFRSLWPARRLVEVAGTADLRAKTPTPEKAVLDVLQKAGQANLIPWMGKTSAKFPYLPVPETTARIIAKNSFPRIGVDRYRLSNGVVLQMKQTDFTPDEFAVTMTLGNGRQGGPLPGLGLLSEMVVNDSGLGGLTSEELEAALAGTSSRVRFRVGEESLEFSGTGLREESELFFQLLAAHVQDPAFRQEAYQRSRERISQMYAQLKSSVEGMMQLEGERFIAGGNDRYGLPLYSDLNQRTLEQVKAWLAPVFKESRLEISVVGDFDKKRVLELVRKYFSGKGRREISGIRAGKGAIQFPSGRILKKYVASATAKALVVVAWPTDDFWDISRTRRLSVLASVLDDRLRKQIREELGATYSPYVYNRSSRVDPGYGVLRAMMIVAPDQAESLAGRLRQVAAELARQGVQDDELGRALQPVVTSIKDMVRTNRYWLESVLVLASRHPRQLEWPLTIQKDFAAITASEITALAKKYLQPDVAAEVVFRTRQ